MAYVVKKSETTNRPYSATAPTPVPSFDVGSHQYNPVTGGYVQKQPTQSPAPMMPSPITGLPVTVTQANNEAAQLQRQGQAQSRSSAALDALARFASGGGGGGGDSNPAYTPLGAGAAGEAPPAAGAPGGHVTLGPPVSSDEADSLAFSAAKSRAGSLGRASLEGLRSELADRGWLGGGTEARGLVDKLAGATNPLSDINVAMAQKSVDRNAQREAMGYQGEITQRGQDLAAANAERSAAIQSQQQIANQNLQALKALLDSASRLY